MIETEQSVAIDAPIATVWSYVQDIRRWANLFPGCRECAVLNENDSRWTLKVGAGGLVRTVNVLVHVERWEAPARVDFTYSLEGDPVKGSGSYVASSTSDRETSVKLRVRVEGSGPMAPMWEAMSRPLLPQLAKSFAGQLKGEIEKLAAETVPTVAAPVPSPPSTPSLLARLAGSLRKLWSAIFPSARARNANDLSN